MLKGKRRLVSHCAWLHQRKDSRGGGGGGYRVTAWGFPEVTASPTSGLSHVDLTVAPASGENDKVIYCHLQTGANEAMNFLKHA